MGERRDDRKKRRQNGGIGGMINGAQMMIANGTGVIIKGDELLTMLLDLFEPDEVQAIGNWLEIRAPHAARMFDLFAALIGELTPDQIKEFKAAVFEKLDTDGDNDIDLDDIPWPGWLRTAWGWIKRFLPGNSQ